MLALLIGATAMAVGLTDRLTRFLRPSMGVWLTIAGAVSVVLGLWTLFVDSRSRSKANDEPGRPVEQSDVAPAEHRWGSTAGWLLLIPFLVLTVIDPGALGSYAVRQQGVYRASAQEVDLAEMLEARSFNDQAVELTVLDLWNALGDSEKRSVLAQTRLRVEGFVVNEGAPAGSFLLARMVMGCCAGDALPLALTIRNDLPAGLPTDSWVAVEGVLDPDATAIALADTESWPVVAGVIDLTGYELIDEPAVPYLYPW